MKTFLLLAVAVAFIGCSKQDRTINERAGADNQENAIDAQKDQIDTAAKEAKEQIKADAKAQEEKIEAQAKSAKAELEAEKARAEADAKAQAKNIDAQSQKIEEAAGAANKETVNAEATQEANAEIQKKNNDTNSFRTALGLSDDKKDIEVHLEDGKATLKGQVASDAEKADLEAKAKAFPGVTTVENNLEVKPQ